MALWLPVAAQGLRHVPARSSATALYHFPVHATSVGYHVGFWPIASLAAPQTTPAIRDQAARPERPCSALRTIGKFQPTSHTCSRRHRRPDTKRRARTRSAREHHHGGEAVRRQRRTG